MANIVLDFLHNYQTGERRESEPANAYQYDEGHVLEAVLPEVITSCEIHYWIRGMEEADAYTPTSITPNSDGSCTVLGNIPNSYFETNGELRIYIVVTDGTASITTYEGKLHICQRSMPDDYVDDDPENEATRILTEAQAAAATATAAAQTAQDVADSIPADYSQMSEDVSQLKEDLTDISNVLSIPYSETAAGTTPQSSQANTIIDGITLESGKSYVIDLTYSAASDAVSYLYLTDSQINVLNSKTINAGTTSVHVVYYAQNSYDNAKLLINSANRALNYELTIREDAENKIDALERDKLSAYEYENAATFTFTSVATMTQPCPVRNGSVYKVTVTGDASVAVNVRSGNGYTNVDDIAVNCYAGNTYFARYTGADAPNLLVFASGACTVTVEDISTLSGSEERRIYATVSTVRELLECIEISHTVKMTIYLMDGVYDLISGLGETYFANAPSQNFGPVLCNDVEIVGGEGAIITANYTGDNTNVMTYFAPFNTGKCVYPWTLYGGFSLINVHLEGSKIRYLVHDENNQHDIPYHNVYDGCYFYFDNSGNTSWGSQAIIGGGLGKHGYIEIKNCVFKTPTLASRSAVVSYHNSLAVGAKSHIVLTGNLIAPLNAVFRLGYHGTSEEKTLVLATNNKWGDVPSVSAETSSDTVNNFELIEWNNVVLS